MPPIPSNLPLVPSVLDRLLDSEPAVSREAPKSRTQVLRELKQSVRRDLENLLNTRRRFGEVSGDLSELSVSLATYGLPDISGADIGSARSRMELRRRLEKTIQTFEPRFKTLSVTLLEAGDASDRVLRFRIDGLLRVEPAPEPVSFNSAVEPATGSVEIRGANP